MFFLLLFYSSWASLVMAFSSFNSCISWIENWTLTIRIGIGNCAVSDFFPYSWNILITVSWCNGLVAIHSSRKSLECRFVSDISRVRFFVGTRSASVNSLPFVVSNRCFILRLGSCGRTQTCAPQESLNARVPGQRSLGWLHVSCICSGGDSWKCWAVHLISFQSEMNTKGITDDECWRLETQYNDDKLV